MAKVGIAMRPGTDRVAHSRFKRAFGNNNSVVILLVLVVAGVAFVDGFTRNISSVVLEASTYGLIAAGLALVMITGNIDLSVGFQAGIAAVVTVLVLQWTGSLALAVIAALVVGAIAGAINGCAVTVLGINPLIATIATTFSFKGLVFLFTKDGALRPGDELQSALKSIYGTELGTAYLNLTVVGILVALALLFFMQRRTRFGRAMYVVGDNPEAGKLAGIRVRRTVFMSYVLCGICCAVAGVFMASRSGGAIYTQGLGREIFALSVCIIGGIKMTGGKGTMINVLLGLLIMRVISTMMNCLLIPTAWVDFVSGCLLIAVLMVDRLTTRRRED